MVAVQLDQNGEWAAIAPLIQAKQREIAERIQAEAMQTRGTTTPVQQVAPMTAGRQSQLDMNDRPRDAPEASRKTSQRPPPDSPRESSQFAFRAHLAFKAQGGDETGLQQSDDPSADERRASSGRRDAFSDEDLRVLKELKARDAEVRRHEQAHAVAAGSYASAPSYVYQQGPDGKQYAIGGSVRIDTAPVPNDPEATIAKMEVIRRAALAPAEPSSADRGIAAAAQAVRAQAVADAATMRQADRSDTLDQTL